jgi:hypothetical protein
MERRKFTRFQTHDNGYAALRGNFTTVGKINDISLNGLSFKYLAKAAQEEEFSLVEIFLVENKFHLRNLPCRLIYQIPDKFDKGRPLKNAHFCSSSRKTKILTAGIH